MLGNIPMCLGSLTYDILNNINNNGILTAFEMPREIIYSEMVRSEVT